ncbi:MAG: putative bifunctional diguanylate cyclase/phosphodiesterase [Ilumatobacteraceae bacterium]
MRGPPFLWMVAVINEDKLSAVLREFARTVITDFPIEGILDHLVEKIVEILPITSAGVTLISAGTAPRYVAASDESALRFEQLQSELDEGPCLAAFESGKAVAISDLSGDDRFPLFAPAAMAEGLAAAFTFPLCHGSRRLGALDLYRATPGALDQHDMDRAQTLADVAAAYLLNAQAREEARVTYGRLLHVSMHDALTGLPNRLLFQERLEHAALRAARFHSTAAILFVDLDNFKLVNEVYGHDVGDQLLYLVAQRLDDVVSPGDTLARFSGDEFVMLCEDLSDVADVDSLARRVSEVLEEPFRLAGVMLAVTASVGIAFAGPGQEISNELVVEADRSMYRVKRNRVDRNGGLEIIDVRSTSVVSHDRLEDEVRAALAGNELDLFYQPIVRSSDGLVAGAEALLRWTHPERGPVQPMAIVAVAEQSALIDDIGAWVLERACRDRGQLLGVDPLAAFDLAVNISARQLLHLGFGRTVADILAATGMDPTALILEVTENVFIEDSDRVLTVLHDLRSMGVRIAIDDFGTGYSSLGYLTRLPIDIIKIDRCFIADTDTAAGLTVVAAITNLAHDLGFTVIAEGVETQQQHHNVAALGCDSAQGYFYAKPMPAAAIRDRHSALRGERWVASERVASNGHTAVVPAR